MRYVEGGLWTGKDELTFPAERGLWRIISGGYQSAGYQFAEHMRGQIMHGKAMFSKSGSSFIPHDTIPAYSPRFSCLYTGDTTI